MIRFAGFDWTVEHSTTPVVGNRNWNNTNVTVDSAGLHLKVRPINGIWCASQVLSNLDMGFGTYKWEVVGRPDIMDANLILGLFQYPRDWANAAGYDEWDFEWSKWGNTARKYNMDVSINPDKSHPDNVRALQSKMLTLPSDQSSYRTVRTNHSMTMDIFNGTGGSLFHWEYAPTDTTLVSQIPQRTIINLWLINGVPPVDGKEVEIIIKNFSYTPTKKLSAKVRTTWCA